MISIIIPTCNRCQLLQRTLESITHSVLAVDAYEVLIIDNVSSDHTAEVFDHVSSKNPTIQWHYHFEPTPGLLSGRHRGSKEARGDILVFCDDDIVADPLWLYSISETFQDPTIQIVGGPSLPDYETPPPDWLESFWRSTKDGGRSCGHLSLIDLGDQQLDIDANSVWGLNFSIRRKALIDLGGFHPDCIPENLQRYQGDGETGLTMKAKERGYRAVYQPNARVRHQISSPRMTSGYFEKRAYYQGVCDSFTAIRSSGRVADAIPEDEFPELTESTGAVKRPTLPSLAKAALSRLKSLGRRSEIPKCESHDEADVIRQRMTISYQAGYAFHQNEVRNDPTLLAWVLKDDYWDYRLPTTSIQESKVIKN